MADKKINICIVHYNTPKLTECLVRSIDKFTPNATIYIFDNSDAQPFTYRQDNIVYFDNTKGQIINYTEWLKRYPNNTRSFEATRIHGSAKHCYAVETCMRLIPEGFILLDSDVLVKRNLSELWDEDYVYVAEVETQPRSTIKRVIPFVCFINGKLCKKNNVHFFDENYMHGLSYTKNNNRADWYDTGSGFYIQASKLPHKEIKWNDYVEHFGSGSWQVTSDIRHKKTPRTAEGWLNKFHNLWEMKKEGEFLEYEQQLKAFLLRHKLNYNIDKPRTIQEKIQWLKLHDSTPLKAKCADKIKVHEYSKEKLGKDICIPIIKVYNSVSDIKWNELPNSFVLKCNHGSGMNIIVKDKSTVTEASAKAKVKKWLETDFAFQNGCEMQYHNIERRAFVEEYMFDENQTKSLYDYKFWCFNGEPKFYTINDGFGHGDIMYYDMNHEELNPYCVSNVNYSPVPPEFEQMQKYAEKLSKDFKFVRVDFYYVGGKIYLGELTFTPGSGLFTYKNEKYSKLFGDMLNLGNSQNKKVIYTCITGEYELLDDPFVMSDGYDYVCFTNYSRIASDIWELRPIPEELNGLSEVKKQRCIKINPHKYLPEYDLSIWVDGSVKLQKDVNDFVAKFCKDGNIFIPEHPTRKCIYDEMDACIKLKKDTQANIQVQREKYTKENFPKNYGLVQSNIIIRRHNEPDCVKLMETWWAEVKNYSHRDQLSFDYARWKNPNVKVVFLDKGTCKTEYFKWDNSHGKKKQGKLAYGMSKVQGQPRSEAKVINNSSIKYTAVAEHEEIREKIRIRTEAKQYKSNTIVAHPAIKRQIMSSRLKRFLNS